MTGSLRLGDLRTRMLTIACGRCARRGSLLVAGLIAEHGRDARLPDLPQKLSADCPHRDRQGGGCEAVYPALRGEKGAGR